MNPGTVYQRDGEVLLYVRTERRPGSSEPEHLFVTTRARSVFSLWLADEPDEADLIIDVEGRQQAEEARAEVLAQSLDMNLALELLRKACAWLPKARADELRSEYQERKTS